MPDGGREGPIREPACLLPAVSLLGPAGLDWGKTEESGWGRTVQVPRLLDA